MSAVIIWSVVEVTFRLGFDRPATGGWVILSYATEVLFFIDILVTFRTVLLTKDGIVVAGKGQVAKAYLKARDEAVASPPSMFPLDFLCRRGKLSLPHLDSDRSIRAGLFHRLGLECDVCVGVSPHARSFLCRTLIGSLTLCGAVSNPDWLVWNCSFFVEAIIFSQLTLEPALSF